MVSSCGGRGCGARVSVVFAWALACGSLGVGSGCSSSSGHASGADVDAGPSPEASDSGASVDGGQEQDAGDVPIVLGMRFASTPMSWRVPIEGGDEGYASLAGLRWGTIDIDGDGRPDLVASGHRNVWAMRSPGFCSFASACRSRLWARACHASAGIPASARMPKQLGFPPAMTEIAAKRMLVA